jgi:hypothetical protein
VSARGPGGSTARTMRDVFASVWAPVAFLEADGVWSDSYEALFGKLTGVRLVRVTGQPDDLTLSKREVASVLMMAKYCRRGRLGILGDAYECSDPLSQRDRVADLPSDVTAAIHLLHLFCVELNVSRGGSKESLDELK